MGKVRQAISRKTKAQFFSDDSVYLGNEKNSVGALRRKYKKFRDYNINLRIILATFHIQNQIMEAIVDEINH